ncbi:linker histone H1 and H5 family-domain-containing protein [Phyllosticta citribraziliensis]|uniref:Histone H1 n=1 Tax=Phyllosticta citribraziliensis TaxID=989973 RepID=A0ABR1M0Z5_9PEZI
MPPKKSAAAAPKKAPSSSAHTSYQAMISDAITALKERSGSSRQAIKKYVMANNKIGDITDNQFNQHINRAIQQGVAKGIFDQPKGERLHLVERPAHPASFPRHWTRADPNKVPLAP